MYLKQLIRTNKTVFSVNDLRLIWKIKDKNYLKTIINRLFKRGELIRVKRGIYSIKSLYNTFELASKIKVPSYISLETVLQKKSVIFQDYSNSVYSVSNNTIQYEVDKIRFNYFKLKDEILFNPLGVENKGIFNIASMERAVADRVYLTPGYYFDNLRGIEIKKLKNISKIYNKRTQKEIDGIIQFVKGLPKL
ncbi:hypothetical protein KAI92_00345 [Candidatus Parcubacteria bacterium]|nr:hypothetical protein [Candidatus Parcubacteria bacterium]